MENGDIAGLVKIFYGLLIALAVGGGLLLIVTLLVKEGGIFDTALGEILNSIIEQIKSTISGGAGVIPPATEVQ